MILTGSAEFFPNRRYKDQDYILFCKQEPVFTYDRVKSECHFCYREGLTKAEYFQWHRTENTWHLNFAPLVTWEFLDRMDIDILGEDRDSTYWVVERAFKSDYFWPRITEEDSSPKYLKWLYRIYIYTCFIRSGALVLSEQERQNAYCLYRQEYNLDVVRSIHKFFNLDPELTELGIRRLEQQS